MLAEPHCKRMIADVGLCLVAILRKIGTPAQQLAYQSMTEFEAAVLGVDVAAIVVVAAVEYAAAAVAFVVHVAAESYQPEYSVSFDFPNLN